MKRTIKTYSKWDYMPIVEILETVATIFFTCGILFSAYLMSNQSYQNGFFVLTITSIYFIANSVAKLKILKALTWCGIFAFALKGFVGI
jgi:hypothetical protein